MNLKKKFLSMFIAGVPLGMIVCLIITALTSTGYVDDGRLHFVAQGFSDFIGNETRALLIQELVTGLYGGIVMGATVAYEVEKWSILRSTLTHFIITFTCYFATGTFLRWYSPSNMADLLGMFAIMLVSYVLIWLFNYLGYRAEVRKINSGLENMKKEDKKQNEGH